MDASEKQAEGSFRLGPIAQFTIKTVVVAAAVSIASMVIIDSALSSFDATLRQTIATVREDVRNITKLGGRQFWTKLEKQLERAADPKSDLPPEKKAKILSEIRTVAERWRPIIAEVSSPFTCAEPVELTVKPK